MAFDNFLNIEFSSKNLDRYLIRTQILQSLQGNLPVFRGDLLDVGCGKMPYKKIILEQSSIQSYTGLDIENAIEYDSAIKPDFTWDGITMPFENNRFQTIMATEVLEHCPAANTVLAEIYRVLKPGGVFFFTVPFLWPLHEVPHDEYRYTPFSLTRLLDESGFSDIRLHATGGWHASLAQMLGLWVRRAPLASGKRQLFSWLLKPIIKKLIAKDKLTTAAFIESQMITGLTGVAFKIQ